MTTIETAPLLSVLIDTYNHERYIEQAVLSAIEQDFPAGDYEIVVVDDGSTDGTPEIVRKFAPRVRLLQKKNGGQASAFNAAIPELRGGIVAFLDGDDWFAPGKLKAVTTALGQHPEAAAVGHGYYEFDQANNESRVCEPPLVGLIDFTKPEVARQYWTRFCRCVYMGALTIRGQALRKIMPIPEYLRFCADTPVAVAAIAAGAYILPQPLFYYRHHGSNLFSSPTATPQDLRRKEQIQESIARAIEDIAPRINIPPEAVEALLEPHELNRERRRFAENPPGRTEFFRHVLRANRWQAPEQGMKLRTINAINALASLAVGYERFGTLDALWRRLDRAKDRLFPPHKQAPDGGTRAEKGRAL